MIVNSRKYDLSIRRSWTCEVVKETDDGVVLVGTFDETVEHKDLGTIESGTVSYEYYWWDRWYSVFRFEAADGSLRNHYCNINMPPTLENGVLDYVDLDLDVVVWPSGTIDVLDRDDFEKNTVKYGYPEHVIAEAENALSEVLELAKTGGLP